MSGAFGFRPRDPVSGRSLSLVVAQRNISEARANRPLRPSANIGALDGTPGVANLRKHGTTGRVPNEAFLAEKQLLIQLPSRRFAVHEDGVWLVDADSTLSISGTPYTVPSALASSTVAVRIYAEHFEVLDRQGRIAFSRRYVADVDKGKLVIDPTHYANLPRGRARRAGDRIDDAFVQRFPTLAPMVDGLRKARAAVDARRTREPGRRAKDAGDPFLLRRLLRCVYCDRLMTTSSSQPLPDVSAKPTRRKSVLPPRYYRCRGDRACRGTQVAADDIESRVLAWLRNPTGDLSPEAQLVLTRFAPLWEVLIPQVERDLVAQLVWEVQWDGPKDSFTVVLDEIAIEQEHTRIRRSDDERASRTKPRRKMKKARRSTRAR